MPGERREPDDDVTELAICASRTVGVDPIVRRHRYLSVPDSSAFSPINTTPLSSRVTTLMLVRATSALLVSLLAIARAVGSLGG